MPEVIDLTLDSSPEVQPLRHRLADIVPHQPRPTMGNGAAAGPGPSSRRNRAPGRNDDVIEVLDSDDDDVSEIAGPSVASDVRVGPPPSLAAAAIAAPPRRRTRGARRVRLASSSEDGDYDDDVYQIMPPQGRWSAVPLAPAVGDDNDGHQQGRLDAAQLRANLAEIDRVIERNARQLDALRDHEAAIRRVANGAPQADHRGDRPRIGLGGAVFRDRDRELRFAPGQPAQQVILGNDAHEDVLGARVPARRQPRRGTAFPGLANFMAPGDEEIINRGLAFLGDQGLFNMFRDIPVMGAGVRRPREQQVPDIIAQIKLPEFPAAAAGYSNMWDIEEIEKEAVKDAAIEIDAWGDVVEAPKPNPYLACANCPEPLRLSGAMHHDEERVWSLRCGHLLDEQCLHKLSDGDPFADRLPPPAKKPRRAKKGAVNPVLEHTWNCPVCDHEHTSQFVDFVWKQKEGLGAIPIFA